MNDKTFPYFEYLLKEFAAGNQHLETLYGRHVHWGYWDKPNQATLTQQDFISAQERLTEKLCQLANIQSGESVLDVGCGFGGTIAYLNEQYQHMKLTGLNIDAKQLERAREHVIAHQNNEVSFVEGNACELPFEDNQFDKLMAVECIFHFPCRDTFLKEAKRVLKPNGCLVISDYISSTFFLPIAHWIKRPSFIKRNPYGDCDLRIQQKDYEALAKKMAMTLLINDVSANTQPTYRYINKHVLRDYCKAMQASPFVRPFSYGYELAAKTKLIRYYLMRFDLSGQ